MENITQFLTLASIIWLPAFLFVLTLVVFFHELGHFLVARWCGVKVDSFSIGFGKEIIGFTDKKGTRWKVSWIPLGGYVKFTDDENAASVPSAEALAAMSEEQKAGAFQLKPLWQRAAVVAAGPIASFLLGIVIFAGTYAVYGQSYDKAYVGGLVPNSPAEKAGFQVDDLILEINDHKIVKFTDLMIKIQLSTGGPLNFKIDRKGQILTLQATPEQSTEKDFSGNKPKRVGIRPSSKKEHLVYQPVNPLQAVSLSLQDTWNIVTVSMDYLHKVVTFQLSPKQLSGVVGIAHTSGKVALNFGFFALIGLAAYMSIAIGLFNLFPIPMLDGGHLMFYAIEAVRGKPLSESVQEMSFRIGMALMLTLMVLVTFMDVTRIFG